MCPPGRSSNYLEGRESSSPGEPTVGTVIGTATKSWIDPECGNGIPEPGETRDDGNSTNNDGCTNDCKTPICGDTIVQTGEECDDGNPVDDDSCTNACTLPICSDGIVQFPEECDDANLENTDACTNACTIARCGDAITQPPEECDDGNTLGGDGCTTDCRIGEICVDQVDNDDDALIDCDDPDCGCLQITPVCNHACPGRIAFRPKKPGHDLFGFQASFVPTQSIDPSTSVVGVTITNANGIIWSATLLPGDLIRHGDKYLFRDKTAKTGPGVRGGLFQLKLKEKPDANPQAGLWRIHIRGYADLSAATGAEMSVQVVVGNEAFERTATWQANKKGWRVKMN